jgi:hypothetical protein
MAKYANGSPRVFSQTSLSHDGTYVMSGLDIIQNIYVSVAFNGMSIKGRILFDVAVACTAATT